MRLFNELVDDEEPRTRTRVPAESIAAAPPIALRDTTKNLNRALTVDLCRALSLEADRLVRSSRIHEHREAVQSFMGKPKAVFNGG